MDKLKNKKLIGIVAAVLPLLWVILSILVNGFGVIFKLGRFFRNGFLVAVAQIWSRLGGMEMFLMWLSVLVVALSIGALSFLGNKLSSKKAAVAEKAIPLFLSIIAIKGVFEFLGYFDTVVCGILMDFNARGELFGVFGILGVVANVGIAVYAAMYYIGIEKFRKFWYAPAALYLIHTVLTFVVYIIMLVVDGWDFTFGTFMTFVLEGFFAFVLAAVGYWHYLPDVQEP